MRPVYFFFIISFLLASCQVKEVITIIPPVITETQPSWDGEKQNSGLLDYIDGKGFLITKGAAERYVFLTSRFGNSLTPHVKPGEGLQPFGENFILSAEYMSIFMEVSRLNKR